MATRDDKKTQETGNAAAEATAPLTVNAQFLRDLSFESPDPIKVFQSLDSAPEVNVSVDIQANPMKENVFEVALKITAEATSKNIKAYVAEVEYAGVFTLGNVPDEAKHPLLMIECPRLLFPFARAILADVTRDGGFPPLSLIPIDFVSLYRDQAERQAADQKTAKA